MMSKFTVIVRWNKERYPDLELDTEQPVLVFKSQVFALTGVPPERQKLMMKGTTINEDWNSIKLKNGAQFLLMGSADALPEKPVEKATFVEDMPEDKLQSALGIPAGLKNLGNTCYMNATLQCFRAVPELLDIVKKYRPAVSSSASMSDSSEAITFGMQSLFTALEKCDDFHIPLLFVALLHKAFPRFAENDNEGHPMQQDASECWTEMMNCLKNKLKIPGPNSESFIDKYFGIEYLQIMKCAETDQEPTTTSTLKELKVSCHIDKDVKYVHTGLQNKMIEKITKFSKVLNKDVDFTQTSAISRLPAYLTLEFIRFQFKTSGNINAKILKNVKFPLELDMFEFCTPELQAKLAPLREKFQVAEETALKKKREDNVSSKEEEMTEAPYSFEDDIGSNNSGFYTLLAVLTHKGRSSNSGHYVAWVRRKQDSDDWFMFDDEDVSIKNTESILDLAGGGDWHCAYVLIYGPKRLKIAK